MPLRAEGQAGCPQQDPPKVRKGGVRRRLAQLFSRSESSLPELQRKEDGGDGPSAPEAAAPQDGKGQSRRKEKERNKAPGSLERMLEEDGISPGGSHSVEDPNLSRAQKSSWKPNSLSYSESDLWRSGLLQTFRSLPWRRWRSSTGTGGTGQQRSLLGQPTPLGRLQRPAVGSDLDMASWLDLSSAGNLAGEQGTPEPSAWPMAMGSSKPASPSQLQIFTSIDSLLGKEDGNSRGEPASISNSSLDFPPSSEAQGEDDKLPAPPEEPSRDPEPLAEWAESLFQEYFNSGPLHPQAAGQPAHLGQGHRESTAEPETGLCRSPAYNHIRGVEDCAMEWESCVLGQPLDASRGVEPAPAKMPAKICYEVVITLTKEEGVKSREEGWAELRGNQPGHPGAAQPAGEAGVSQGFAESQKMDEPPPGEPAQPAPQLAVHKEFQNFPLQREGTAGVAGQVRPVTGRLVIPAQESEPSPRQRRDGQERSLAPGRDFSAPEGRAGSPASSSSGQCTGAAGEEAPSERPCDTGTGEDPGQCKMEKVNSRSHPSKPGESGRSTWFSWWKKTPVEPPEDEVKPCKVSPPSRRLKGTTGSPARAHSPSRVSKLREAWEKRTMGSEAADSRRSHSPGRWKDFSAHTPVFAKVYSPVPREGMQMERGRRTAGLTTVTDSQSNGHLPIAFSTIASAGSPGERHLLNATDITTPIESSKANHTPHAIGTSTPPGSPGESHEPGTVGITSVTSPPRQWHVVNAGSSTVFRSEWETLTPQPRSGRDVHAPGVESSSVNDFAPGRPCDASSTSGTRSPRESSWQCAGGGLLAPGEPAGSSASGPQGESCTTQDAGADVNDSQGDMGLTGAFGTSITESQRPNSPSAASSSDTDGSLPGLGGAAPTGSEVESGVPGTEGALETTAGTKNTSNAAGVAAHRAQGESSNPEPFAGVQLSPTASQAEFRGEGDREAQNSKGCAQEPNVSADQTSPSCEARSHGRPTGSPKEMAEEDPDLSVDMELLVDTLRSMETSDIRNPLKVFWPLRSSWHGKCATLPPIDEHQVTPKSLVSLPESLNELFCLTQQKHLEENGWKRENVSPSEGEEEMEEEEEIENPYFSKEEKPQVIEEPRKVYPWENVSADIEEKPLSLLGKLWQHPEEQQAKSSASRNQSLLLSTNIPKGTSLLTDFQQPQADPTEDRPYSRLGNSIIYRRYVSPVTSPLTALEKEREGRRSPTPIDLTLLNASGQCWTPPNGPQSKPCEHLTCEPSPAEGQEGRVVSPDDQKVPGTEKSTGQIPLLFGEAEQKTTPSLEHPAAEESNSILHSQEDAKSHVSKLNRRPGKIVLFSQPGFASQKREIWGDVADATAWQLSHTISVRVVRGGWLMYEKPRFHGLKCVLAEGDVEISNPWAAYRKGGEAPENMPFRIGSLKRAVKDYQIPEISLFSEENGEGTKVRFMDSSEDTRIHGEPLKASSIIVHSGLWLIYSKPFFDDDPFVLEPGGYPNLKAWGAKDTAVCSLHPIKLGCPAVEKPGEPKAVIYEMACFQGHSCEVTQDIYDLKTQANRQGPAMATVGSLRILGGCWIGYGKEGFRGHQYLLEEGEYPDWTQWGGYDDELGSLRLIRTDFSEPALVLFKATDFQDGPSVELSEALPDVELAGYGTTTQSIHVLSGVWVAYENTNFSGEQYILEKGVYRNCEDWGARDSRISSVQPVLQVGEHSLRFVSRIQLFSAPSYLGEHISFEDNQTSLPEAFTPQSCRVHGGSWILYGGRAFEGEQHVLLDGEYPTLSAMGCVSSTAIRSLKKVPIFFSEPSILLHGLERFEGKEIELSREVRSLQAEGFNNHVLSVRVKGGIWVLCEHSNFRGRQWLLERSAITNWLTYSGLQHIGSLYPIRQRRIYFRIENVELQLFLSVPDDVEDMKAGRVVVSDLADQSSSIWYYEEGLIKNQAAPTMSLQVIGLSGKGAKVVLWAENRVPRQTWRIDALGQIWSQMFEGMILDVKGGRAYDRDHAVLWDVAEERPTQIWDIQVL